VEPGSVAHTDGWLGYEPLEKKSYRHIVTFLRGQEESPSELMPSRLRKKAESSIFAVGDYT
jgi:hypothetical protein